MRNENLKYFRGFGFRSHYGDENPKPKSKTFKEKKVLVLGFRSHYGQPKNAKGIFSLGESEIFVLCGAREKKSLYERDTSCVFLVLSRCFQHYQVLVLSISKTLLWQCGILNQRNLVSSRTVAKDNHNFDELALVSSIILKREEIEEIAFAQYLL